MTQKRYRFKGSEVGNSKDIFISDTQFIKFDFAGHSLVCYTF